MMFLETNVLNANIFSEVYDFDGRYNSVLDYLKVYHKAGFAAECDIFVNNRTIGVESFNDKLYENDLVVLVHRQGVTAAAVGGSYILAFFVNVAISAAASYAMAKIFPPDVPDGFGTTKTGNRGAASSVYSLNSQQNEAKIGQVIPIIYGEVRTYPALIAPPYYRYENNEEYLYQLMCIGQGKYNIDKMMISDTDTVEIQSDFFRYEKLEYDDFKTVGGIATKVNDSNYHQLVKTIPDVDSLELRGTPSVSNMFASFSGSEILFHRFVDGSLPDISSLSNGSNITIESGSNAGSYTVDYIVGDDTVVVQSHTFITDTPHTKTISGLFYTSNNNLKELNISTSLMWTHEDQNWEQAEIDHLGLNTSTYYKTDTPLNSSSEISVTGIHYGSLGDTFTKVGGGAVAEVIQSGSVTFTEVAKEYSFIFETSYGAYSIRNICSKDLEYIEIDYAFLGGIYNTDVSNDFIDRTVEFEVTIYYTQDSTSTIYQRSTQTVSTTAKDNSPIRKTLRFIPADLDNMCDIFFQNDGNIHILLKRVTPEPSDINSYDKIHIRSIKALYEAPDNEPLGDITLLWCKIRASNAISSIGQFSLNAWVTRNDVGNTVKDVITDIYTNDVYGGRLAAADLELADTPDDVVNGAYDSKLTVMDAMTTAAKSNRYSIYPVGQKIQIKHDSVKPVRSGHFNETNIIQDTLKISYNFSETIETDSVKITYRSPTEFKLAEAIYPTAGENPEILELWGCTDEAIALAMATYLYKQGRSRRKIVEFKTDLQGLLPQFYDRIGVSHNMPEWGVASQVIAVNGTTVTLDDEIEAGYDSIIFRKDDGSVSDILALSGSGYDVTVVDVPVWVHGYDDVSEPTKCSVGTSSSILQDFLITSIKPDGKTVLIEGVNYDESIYS